MFVGTFAVALMVVGTSVGTKGPGPSTDSGFVPEKVLHMKYCTTLWYTEMFKPERESLAFNM